MRVYPKIKNAIPSNQAELCVHVLGPCRQDACWLPAPDCRNEKLLTFLRSAEILLHRLCATTSASHALGRYVFALVLVVRVEDNDVVNSLGHGSWSDPSTT